MRRAASLDGYVGIAESGRRAFSGRSNPQSQRFAFMQIRSIRVPAPFSFDDISDLRD